jgi:tetratricopeptide (TPR) repeat protein
MADTWARAGDDRALREFYALKLKEVSSAEGQAQLRRSLIPVLSRMKDYPGALDQYIEIARRFPDDEALIREASTFARRHNIEQRLTGFLQNAERQAPKDARWPVLLARVLTYLEQPETAIDAYTRASTLRPDRTDLLSARADLEDRLLRFEQSAATYARLYELTYRDPAWMVKSAEAQARLGRKDAAVAALRKAFMEDRPAQPRDYIEAARRLASWNMIPEAKDFADKAPPDEDPAFQQLLRVRLRQPDWRRPETLVGEAAAAVDTYYTPEEKTVFAAALAKVPNANARTQIARAAGLQDALARDLRATVRQQPANAREFIDFGGLNRVISLAAEVLASKLGARA